MKLTRANDVSAVFSHILIHGESGVGKTWRIAQAVDPAGDDKVFLVLTEANGVQSARHANPNAILPTFQDKDGTERNYVRTMDELRECLRLIAEGKTLKGMGVTVIAFDGLTEIQQLMRDEILSSKKGTGRHENEQIAGISQDKDLFTLQDWGVLADRMRKFLRWMRSVKFHVIMTCLTVESGGGDSGEPHRVRLQLQGKATTSAAPGFFNAVGYCSNVEPVRKGNGVRRITMFEGPSRFLCKPSHPLTGTTEEPIHQWIKTLKGDK